jgi:hypothetical protein
MLSDGLKTTGDQAEEPKPEPSSIPLNFIVSELPVDVSSITVNALHAEPLQISPVKVDGALEPRPT